MVLIRHRYADYKGDAVTIVDYTVTYKDVFSMKYLYSLMHQWLVDEGYAPNDDSTFPEVFYAQRESPISGKEIWVMWRLSKGPGHPLFRYDVDIDIHVMGMKEVEVILQGKKVKADKGEVLITVRGNMVTQFEKWEGNSLLKPLKNMLVKKVYGKKYAELRTVFVKDMYDFQEAIKTYLKLETYAPPEERDQFWEKRDLT